MGRRNKTYLDTYVKSFQPDYQVIYTTHSPFMIDIENIFSMRTVKDVVEQSDEGDDSEEVVMGTKVGEEILTGDHDTILPLLGNIGVDITQTLFVGPYVVVVEGSIRLVLSELVHSQTS